MTLEASAASGRLNGVDTLQASAVQRQRYSPHGDSMPIPRPSNRNPLRRTSPDRPDTSSHGTYKMLENSPVSVAGVAVLPDVCWLVVGRWCWANAGSRQLYILRWRDY